MGGDSTQTSVLDVSDWAEVNLPPSKPNTPRRALSSRKRILNVKYCIRGQHPINGASAMIPWCDNYEQALEASKKALTRYLPVLSDGWNWWLATSDPYDSTSSAEITPDAFAAVVEPEDVKLFLCGDPITSNVVLYRIQPKTEKMRYYSFKLLAIGDSGVGKTAFIKHFSTGRFFESTSVTIQCADEPIRRFATRSGRPIELLVQDTAGQERFMSSLPPTIFRKVAGVFLVYDVSEGFSSEKNKAWVKLARQFDEDVPILLVGNKSDQAREEGTGHEERRSFKDEHHLFDMIETSSKSGHNVDVAFQKLVQEVFARAKRSNTLPNYLKGSGVSQSGVDLEEDSQPRTWGNSLRSYAASRYC